MDNSSGTNPLEGGSNDWVFLEAEEEGGHGDDEEYNEADDLGEDLLDFIDDTLNSKEGEDTADYYRNLDVQYEREQDARAVHVLKRKFLESPKTKVVNDLSPRIAAISLQEKQQPGRVRRKLYRQAVDDSGNGDSLEETCGETVVGASGQVNEKSFLNSTALGVGDTPTGVGNGASTQEMLSTGMLEEDYACSITNLLQAGKPRTILLGLFKKIHGCSFTDLCRCFQSNKTVSEDWIVCVAGIPCSLIDGISDLLKPHSDFTHVTCTTCELGVFLLLLVQWKTGKNRETVTKLLAGLFSVQKEQMLLEPPKLRQPAVAMFWYKKALTNASVVTGNMPQWILRQISIQEQLGDVSPFCLSNMIQWAYDNGHDTEHDIAYEYAKLADIDKNANAFLNSNCQAKYVKDCCNMVRLYKKAEMFKMSMSQWITHRCSKVEGEGDWKAILTFLKFQNVEIMPFLISFRDFLKGRPKRNCLVIYGPANTGKSLFGMTLMSLLGGKIISFVNSQSHFWLTPLSECKVAMLDDATVPTWDYTDTYLRNMLDGNPICVDAKHRSHMQIKCPPVLITTNVDVLKNEKWKYLHSRIKVLEFLNECPLDSRGEPVFQLNKENWKAFLKKCWSKLSLDETNERGDESPLQPLRCAARAADATD
uniref:Replication protein E1 n=1 Tax=Phocoena spinipinnis papillomavirus TaxID=82676 RepID=A0A2L1DGF4_PSPV|nr:E1 protein [Omikronpapillomavirus 1]